MIEEGLAEVLRDGIERATRKMGILVDDAQVESLTLYVEELRRWNKAYNLVGRNIGKEGLVSLIIDAISPLSIKGLFADEREALDIGSGAGLPGIPLYLLAGPFPLTLVESQRKKIAFLRHICRKLALDMVRIYPGRFEEMTRSEDDLSKYEIGFARAVTDPLRLLKQARPLMSDGGRTVLFVGKNDADRMRRASIDLEERFGLRIEGIRSTERIVGKEHFLVIAKKARP